MEAFIRISVALVAVTLASCATYETTLTNAQGQTTTCKASGKNGIVTGYYLRKGFEDCVDHAKAAGYSEGQPVKTAAAT